MRRVADTPVDFLIEPRNTASPGGVEVSAVVGDLWRRWGHQPDTAALAVGAARPTAARDRERLAVVLLLCWLLADEAFSPTPPVPTTLKGLLDQGAADLAEQVTSVKFLHDPHRREELVRFALARLELRPAGETVAQAQDRLASLSSAERARVLKASRAAEARAGDS